jgi:PAS domain S-box-containing protein
VTTNSTRIAHCIAARAFAERVSDFTRALEERRHRSDREVTSETRRSSDLERKEHLLEAALAEIKDQFEELLVADEELRIQMDALVESSHRVHLERGRYLELFEELPLACILTDRAGVIQTANRAATRLLDVEERRLRGRSIAWLVDTNDAGRVRRALEAANGSTDEHLVRVQRPRGARFDGVLTATSVEGGRRTLITIRALEAPPIVATDEVSTLVRTVRDKDELLARERALRAQLEKTDRAKDRFIAILSHDLRGPINSVLGWTQLLRREQLSREARERALETIERSSRAQLALVEELLDLSRVTADKMVLEVAPLDLALTVRGLVETFIPAASDAGVTLVAEITTSPTTVFADRKRITQVVTNLVTNAIKFTPPGGRVSVRVMAEGAMAVLEVEDTGQGMKPETLPELFDCYRQNCVAATARNGLGLGLYIVRQLVQLHGGMVEASSAGPGLGSKLTVRLPLRETTPSVASERALPEDSTTDLDGVRILVVEDEPDARELLMTVLAGNGANVSAASDASQAIAMFESCSPDIIVSDIEMPGEDGCSLIRRLKKSADVPAIAVSGFAAQKDAERALDAGFDVHVSKPIEPRELVRRIRALSLRARTR